MPRLLRINAGAGPEYVVERDGEVRKLVGNVFGDWQEGLRLPDGLEGARVLSPVLPSKIVAVGLNYADHVAESGMDTPPFPVFFNKQSTCVTVPTIRSTCRASRLCSTTKASSVSSSESGAGTCRAIALTR